MNPGSVRQDKSEWNVVFIPKELDDYPLTMAEFRAYSRVARRAGDDGTFFEGVPKASKALMMHEDTLRDALEALVAFNLIKVQFVPGRPNEYTLVPASKWMSSAKAIQWRAAREATRSEKRAAKAKVRNPSTNSPRVQKQEGGIDTPPPESPDTPPSKPPDNPPEIEGDEGSPLKVLPEGTSTTTSTELDYQTDSSGETVAVEIQNSSQPQTPGSDARDRLADLEGSAGRDGNPRTGFEDSPGAAATMPDDPDRARAADLLAAYLGGTQCRDRYPRDHQIWLENRMFWFENRPGAFVIECITLARNAKGVDKNPFGALVKWLENPVSAPDTARELILRLERGLTPRLERLPRRWYRTGDGLDVFVERWKAGDAVLEGGSPTAKVLTRLWTLLPPEFSPDDAREIRPAPTNVAPRVSAEAIAAGLQKLGIKPKTTGDQP
jgi:hypothetical protein